MLDGTGPKLAVIPLKKREKKSLSSAALADTKMTVKLDALEEHLSTRSYVEGCVSLLNISI